LRATEKVFFPNDSVSSYRLELHSLEMHTLAQLQETELAKGLKEGQIGFHICRATVKYFKTGP